MHGIIANTLEATANCRRTKSVFGQIPSLALLRERALVGVGILTPHRLLENKGRRYTTRQFE